MIAGADFIRYLLSAGGVSLVFLVAAIALQARGRSARARGIVLAVAAAFAVMSNYAIQYRVTQLIVGGFRPVEARDVPAHGRIAVVLLGSGSETVDDWSGASFSVVDRTSAARVFEAFRVYRLIDPAVIVSSGGDPHPELHHEPSGNAMREALVSLGVPRARIVVETKSATTRDEAVIVAPMLKALRVDDVVLVTSEVHMRRSLGSFRSVGIHAIPAIARDLEPADTWTKALLPTDSGLDAAAGNVHEVFGLVYYWMRGWWTR